MSFRDLGVTVLLSLLSALLTPPCHSEGLTPGPKFALIIGNAVYSPAVGALKNPVNDATDMCTTLGSLGFKTFCYFNVASRVQFRSLIQDFFDALPDSAVTMVYYAGHAIQLGGENYLIPTAAELRAESAVDKESVSLAYLMRQIRQTHSYLNVIVIDACRTNPWGSTSSMVIPGLAPVTDAPDRSMVLYATGADDVAADGAGRNGIMTKNIIAAIREPGTIQDLFSQVGQGMKRDTLALGRPQQPGLYTNFVDRYCLLTCTEVETLQNRIEQERNRVTQLQSGILAGDKSHKAELDAANAALKKLESQVSAKEKEIRDRQRNQLVPPAM